MLVVEARVHGEGLTQTNLVYFGAYGRKAQTLLAQPSSRLCVAQNWAQFTSANSARDVEGTNPLALQWEESGIMPPRGGWHCLALVQISSEI